MEASRRASNDAGCRGGMSGIPDHPPRIPHPESCILNMVDLFCTPFVDLIQRMRLEFRNQQTIFDLPARKFYAPTATAASPGASPDLSVQFHDRVAGNASGPASG